MQISRRHVLASQVVAQRLPGVLSARGLDAHALAGWYLTAERGEVWLFAEMNPRRVERLERYTAQALVHHISTVCDGTPVVLSNSSGLRYCFLLSRPPRLPRSADFPGCQRDLLRLGVGQFGLPIAVRWNDLGHLLVAGMTGSGKSNFLRLLVHQGLAQGARLLLADVDGRTFPMLRDHPALGCAPSALGCAPSAPIAETPPEVHAIVARALAECDRRSALYDAAPGYPDTLADYNAAVVRTGGEPLPRLLVVLDEFNAAMTALGGNRGQFAADVTALGWRGRKFGLHLIFAAQDFSKAVVGRVRDQVSAIVCFQVRSPEVARNVGVSGADKIPAHLPGRAVTDRWGLLQTYYLDKTLLSTGHTPGALTPQEMAMVGWALERNDAYLTLADIQEHGIMGTYQARKLADDWERRGWLSKDPNAANKRRITPELAALSTNRQTAQTPANPLPNRQTSLQTDKPARQTDRNLDSRGDNRWTIT